MQLYIYVLSTRSAASMQERPPFPAATARIAALLRLIHIYYSLFLSPARALTVRYIHPVGRSDREGIPRVVRVQSDREREREASFALGPARDDE